MTVNFNATKKDIDIIKQIGNRAVSEFGIADKTNLLIDITATHCNGNRLDLERLLTADRFNFAHDIFGIMGHIDRRSGKLKDCFVPRFTARPKKGFYSQAAEDERQKRRRGIAKAAAIIILCALLPGCRGCNPVEPNVDPTPTTVPTSVPTAASTPTPANTPFPTATATATATAIPTPVATVAVTPTDGLHTIRYHCLSDAAFNYVHYQYPNGETHDLNIGASHEWTLTFQFTRSGAPVYPPNLSCEINIDYSKVPFGNYTIIAEIYVDDVFVAVMYDTSHARATFAY